MNETHNATALKFYSGNYSRGICIVQLSNEITTLTLYGDTDIIANNEKVDLFDLLKWFVNNKNITIGVERDFTQYAKIIKAVFKSN